MQLSAGYVKSVTGNGVHTPYALTARSKLTQYFSPVCDSYVRPETLVRICDECNFGTYGGRCIICGSPGQSILRAIGKIISRRAGISDAYYCAECTRLEKDRDGCPKIVNLGASRTDLFYERRRLGEAFPIVPSVGTWSLMITTSGFKKG